MSNWTTLVCRLKIRRLTVKRLAKHIRVFCYENVLFSKDYWATCTIYFISQSELAIYFLCVYRSVMDKLLLQILFKQSNCQKLILQVPLSLFRKHTRRWCSVRQKVKNMWLQQRSEIETSLKTWLFYFCFKMVSLNFPIKKQQGLSE